MTFRSTRAVMTTAGVALAAMAPLASRPSSPTAGSVLVANQQSSSASLIDLATGAVRSIAVGAGPHEAVIAPSGRTAVVTIYGTGGAGIGNQLAVVALPAGTVTKTISLGEYTRPHGAMFLPNDEARVVVTSETTQNLVLVNLAEGRVEQAISTGAPASHMVAVTANGARAFTANVMEGSVSEIDLRAKKLVRVIPVATVTEGVAVTPDGREVWVGSNDQGTVSIVDTQSGKVVHTLSGFAMPYRLAMSPDGRTAIVCDPKGNRIHVVDVAARKVVWTLDSLASPRGVNVAPDNRTAFVTLAGNSTVAVVDLESRTIVKTFKVEASPDGVWYGPPAR